jgi:hypothetical protein
MRSFADPSQIVRARIWPQITPASFCCGRYSSSNASEGVLWDRRHLGVVSSSADVILDNTRGCQSVRRLVGCRRRRSKRSKSFFFATLDKPRSTMKKRRHLSDVHQHPPSPPDRSRSEKGRDHCYSLYSKCLRKCRHPCGQFESVKPHSWALRIDSSSRMRSAAFLRSSEEDVYYRNDSMLEGC